MEQSGGPAAVRLDERDNVACALADVAAGDEVRVRGQGPALVVRARQAVPFGHKLALAPVPRGGTVTKYGHSIGVATADICPGDHVHVHNLRSDRGRR